MKEVSCGGNVFRFYRELHLMHRNSSDDRRDRVSKKLLHLPEHYH